MANKQLYICVMTIVGLVDIVILYGYLYNIA